MPVPSVGVTVFFFFFFSFLRVIVVCYKVQSRKTTSKYMISYYQNWTEMKRTEQKALKINARERITRSLLGV
jgi:hypothetical protein